MNLKSLMVWAGAFGLCMGCSSARDVDVSGEITDPDAVARSESLVLAFYERSEAADGSAEAGELTFVHAVDLDAVGDFEEVVPLEGEKVYAIAFADADDDGACTDGEAWGDTEVTIAEDDTAELTVRIGTTSKCPELPSDE